MIAAAQRLKQMTTTTTASSSTIHHNQSFECQQQYKYNLAVNSCRAAETTTTTTNHQCILHAFYCSNFIDISNHYRWWHTFFSLIHTISHIILKIIYLVNHIPIKQQQQQNETDQIIVHILQWQAFRICWFV